MRVHNSSLDLICATHWQLQILDKIAMTPHRHCVQRLQAAVVAQDVEHRAVRLPQELEPRRHQLPVRAVLFVISE